MRTKKGFINKPFDIAAGFILALIGLLIMLGTYTVANSIDIDDSLEQLTARNTLLHYLTEEYEEQTIAELIENYPTKNNKELLITKTTHYFENTYNEDWTLVISYKEAIIEETLFINNRAQKEEIATLYLPLPDKGYAKITLYFPRKMIKTGPVTKNI